MRVSIALLAIVVAGVSFADTLQLKNGKIVKGTYLGGNSRQIRMEVADRVESFDVTEVLSVRFEADAAQTQPASSSQSTSSASTSSQSTNSGGFREATTPRERQPILRPGNASVSAPQTSAAEVEIPSGTSLTIRMIDAVDSEVNQLGQTFQASLDEPVVVDGRTVLPRNADVIVKLVEDQQSGKISGRTELGLALQSVKVDGRVVDITTEEVTQSSSSRGAKSGKVIGGTAALGAIIGGIAGGGKGAAIGAVSGAGAGTAVQVMTKGQKVRIPSETRLTFTLSNPVRI